LTLLVATTPDQNAISGRRTPYKQHQIRDGDWECHECGFRVFETKSQCFKCGAIKAGANPTSVRLTRRARVHKQRMRGDARHRHWGQIYLTSLLPTVRNWPL
jgi:hypothetical protein